MRLLFDFVSKYLDRIQSDYWPEKALKSVQAIYREYVEKLKEMTKMDRRKGKYLWMRKNLLQKENMIYMSRRK